MNKILTNERIDAYFFRDTFQNHILDDINAECRPFIKYIYKTNGYYEFWQSIVDEV